MPYYIPRDNCLVAISYAQFLGLGISVNKRAVRLRLRLICWRGESHAGCSALHGVGHAVVET